MIPLDCQWDKGDRWTTYDDDKKIIGGDVVQPLEGITGDPATQFFLNRRLFIDPPASANKPIAGVNCVIRTSATPNYSVVTISQMQCPWVIPF